MKRRYVALFFGLGWGLVLSGAQAELVPLGLGAGPIQLNLLENGSASASGRITPGGVDIFALEAPADSVLLVSVHTNDAGEFEDPVLGVFAPGEDTPRWSDDDGGPGFLSRIAVPLDQSGGWRIAVSGSGDERFDGSTHEERFDYRLDVAVVADLNRIDEGEGQNDGPLAPTKLFTPSAATAIAVIAGELTPGGVDHFRLPGGRQLLAASLFDDAGGEFNDSLLQLLDREAALSAANDDGGPRFLSNLTGAFPRCSGEILAVRGFDTDPDDGQTHREDLAYHLVVTTAGEEDAAVPCDLRGEPATPGAARPAHRRGALGSRALDSRKTRARKRD